MRVVNDILDLSKVESGKLALQKAPFQLCDLIREIDNLFGLAARQKDIVLLVPNDLQGQFVGDAVRIGQVLINLVSNALKFTDHGSITIDVDAAPLGGNTSELTFHVIDTGMGIETSQLDVIFDSFTQGSVTSRESGTGLGLSICQSLVEMMSGEIHVTSRPGEGSHFYFTVVVPNWEEQPVFSNVSHTESPNAGGRRVLLVEDNQINQHLANSVLQKAGFAVTVADNGAIAIDKLRSNNFEVVLMDIRMPVMDGIEAIKIIRADADLKSHLVIALLAGVLESEISQAMDAGFDDYMGKPVDFPALLARLQVSGNQQPTSVEYKFNNVDCNGPLQNNDFDSDLVVGL